MGTPLDGWQNSEAFILNLMARRGYASLKMEFSAIVAAPNLPKAPRLSPVVNIG
jgi:hypothetical protein